jgi:hypothetical protein
MAAVLFSDGRDAMCDLLRIDAAICLASIFAAYWTTERFTTYLESSAKVVPPEFSDPLATDEEMAGPDSGT